LLPVAAPLAADLKVQGNVTLASDYVTRGLSANRGRPSAYGALDVVWGNAIAGVSAVNNDLPDGTVAEVVGHVAYTGATGDVSWQLDAARHLFPGAADRHNADYFEFGGLLSWSVSPLSLSGAAYWSPHYGGGLGHEVYVTGLASLALPVQVLNGVFLRAGGGWQWVEESVQLPDILDWQAGIAVDTGYGEVSLMYSGNDLERSHGNRLTVAYTYSF
jgi:uncharacterized protein (TIGR02001 family)